MIVETYRDACMSHTCEWSTKCSEGCKNVKDNNLDNFALQKPKKM